MTKVTAYAALSPGAELESFTYDAGPLGDFDIEIAVKYCGICHSDLSMINNEWGMSAYPLVAGHEVAGVVSALGEQVTGFELGQKVGLGWHADYCKQCDSCHHAEHNLCADAQGTIIGRHGGFADKVRANYSSVVALPDELDLEYAGPLFCGGITVYNPLVQYNIKPTDSVAVIGIGGLGHMALQFLRAWGCRVTAFTSSSSKTEEALSLGAHATIDSRDPDALANAAGQFDLIISTVNVALDWNAYIAALKPKGRLHFVGATLEPLNIGVFGLLLGQKQISASPVGSPNTIAEMLDFAARHQIKPQIELFDFKDINQAIAHLAEGKARYRVVLAQP